MSPRQKMPGFKDLLVLVNLRRNSRKNLTSISRDTQIPVTTVFDKVRRLNLGIIKKHTSLLDFSRLGYNTQVNLALLCKNKKETLAFLKQHSNVNAIYGLERDYDYYVELIFRNLKELEEFTEKLDDLGVKKFESHHVIEELKKEAFLTDIAHLKDYSLSSSRTL